MYVRINVRSVGNLMVFRPDMSQNFMVNIPGICIVFWSPSQYFLWRNLLQL